MSIQDKFDEFCRTINWEDNYDWEFAKHTMAANFSWDEVRELERFAHSLKTRLQSALNAYQRAMDVTLSVSSSEDLNLLLSQIVAEGGEATQFFLDEPIRIQALFDNEEFEYDVDFFNCFPKDKKEFELLSETVKV